MENRIEMLKLDSVVKTYGDINAVNGISFNVKKGEIFGLLGPNGAGKTTIIKLLTALTKPDSGKCLLNGIDVFLEPERIKPLIGVVPQANNLDRDLTAYENMLVYGMLHKVKELKEKIFESLKLMELFARKDDAVADFSGGMQRRLLIARALLPVPSVLFLDEPSIGLDPQVRRNLWDIIRRTKYHGRTVFLTTHYIEEAEALCDRVAILSKGSLMTTGSPKELKALIGKFVVEYPGSELKMMQKIMPTREEAFEYAKNINNGDGVSIIRRSRLEDVFIKLTGERME